MTGEWWVISGAEMLDALRRCAAGEDPDLIYAELYANSKAGRVERDQDD